MKELNDKVCCKGDLLSHDEVQHRLYEMLDKYDAFCTKNGLKYFLADGTLLGSIRHDGFIPWDDDVDVLMPREDYERFIKYDSIDDGIDIVSFHNSKSYYHPYIYCNLADKTTVIDEANVKKSTGKGLFIDVFPLDGIPNNSISRYIFFLRIWFLRTLINSSNKKKNKSFSFKNIILYCFISLSERVNIAKQLDKLDLLMKKYPLDKSEYCKELVDGALTKSIWNTIDFGEIIRHRFEERSFSVPVGFDNILKNTYGDYMTLPPEEDRAGHHGITAYYRNQ